MLEASKILALDPVANHYFPFSQELPGVLLKYGERDSVIEFLERYAKLNPVREKFLLESAALIRKGIKPLWYPGW